MLCVQTPGKEPEREGVVGVGGSKAPQSAGCSC
jgi:hypothetical protein